MTRILVLFARALRLRCPACGGRPIFVSWWRLCPNCPACSIKLQRGEDGYWVGAYMFNLIAAELIWAGLTVGVLVWTWPAPPWTALLVGGVVLMVGLPVLLFPFARTTFLAFDLVFRPPKEDDYPGPHEPAAQVRAGGK